MSLQPRLSADLLDRLADAAIEQAVGHLGELLAIAERPEASENDRQNAATAWVILKMAIAEAEETIAAIKEDACKDDPVLRLAHRRFEIWQKTLASLEILRRPIGAGPASFN